VRELAPAKINLCLYVGHRRPDGYHDLLSVMQSIDLADELELRDADGARDEVRCPAVDGPNLAEQAIAAFRAATGWDGPSQLLTITKRIPIAAGLGGGSADAAATLRLLARRAGLGTAAQLQEIAKHLGADVPSQLAPGRWLAEGIGERLTRLPNAPPIGYLIVPSQAKLSTAAVYAEADRLRLTRGPDELKTLRTTIDPTNPKPVNDLEPAARSLEPTIEATLERLSGAGFVTGSGPTVVGLFPTLQEAADAAAGLRAQGLGANAAGAVHNHLPA